MRSSFSGMGCGRLIQMLIGCGLLALAGCQGRQGEPEASSVKLDAAGGDFPLAVTDGVGRRSTISRPPRRIVSIAPKNTELLFAVGAGEQIVGVTSFCNFPPQAKERAQVGGFSSQSLSIERIVSLDPDLVLAAGSLHEPVIAELERLEVPVLALAAESLGDMFREIELLGRITGHEAQARVLIESMTARIAGVREAVRDLPTQERVTVFYQVWDEPLIAAGPASYIGEMIVTCGGVNVIDDPSAAYLPISHEVLVDRDPEVILAPARPGTTIEALRRRPGWSNVRAVRNTRIHLLVDDEVSRCGPRLVDALETMARAIYPDRFGAAAGNGAGNRRGNPCGCPPFPYRFPRWLGHERGGIPCDYPSPRRTPGSSRSVDVDSGFRRNDGEGRHKACPYQCVWCPRRGNPCGCPPFPYRVARVARPERAWLHRAPGTPFDDSERATQSPFSETPPEDSPR